MQIRKSLKLTTEEWQRLDELAAEFRTEATTGTRAGKPAWRALIKAIANGKIKLVKETER
jgi:hypothetical protein